jgi:glycosyltransferase involved in cell wall biosynthesis
MTTAVVMCTYNGEKYIQEQLESIYNQIRKPDEVIIQDDRSMDNTVQIIRDFIEDKNLTASWHVYVNDTNLGWKKNFMTAMGRASSDLIFLSDQDDIWDEKKIEIMADICNQNRAIELLVCRHEPFDSETGKEAYHYQPSYGDEDVTQVPFDGAFAETRRPGCTYALRKELLQYVDEMWHEEWPHDQFFWCIAIARGTLYSYNKPLVKFRRHEDSNSPSNEKSREIRAELARTFADISGELIDNKERLGLTVDVENTLTRSQTVNQKRAEYISERNVPGVILLLTKLEYYTRFKAWLGDLLVVVR